MAEVCEMGRCVCTAGGRLAGCTRVCVCVAQGWSRVQWPGPPWATSGVSNSRSTWSTASNQSSARMAARWAEAAQFLLRTSRSAAARGMPLDKSGRALLVNLGLGLVFIDCSQRWGAELGGTRNAALRRRALQPLPPLPLSPSAAASASSPQGCSLRSAGRKQGKFDFLKHTAGCFSMTSLALGFCNIFHV